MDLLSIGELARIKVQLTEFNAKRLSCASKDVLLEELEVGISTHEIDASCAENDKHSYWDVDSVECLHKPTCPSCGTELRQLLMWSLLHVLNP